MIKADSFFVIGTCIYFREKIKVKSLLEGVSLTDIRNATFKNKKKLKRKVTRKGKMIEEIEDLTQKWFYILNEENFQPTLVSEQETDSFDSYEGIVAKKFTSDFRQR